MEKKTWREECLEMSDDDLSIAIHNIEVDMRMCYLDVEDIDELNKSLQTAKNVLKERGLL